MTDNAPLRRRELQRSRSNFATKTPTDEENQLGRRWSIFTGGSPSPRNERQNPLEEDAEGRWNSIDGLHRSEPLGFFGRLREYFGSSGKEHGSRNRPRPRRRSTDEPLLATATGFDYRAIPKRESHDRGKARTNALNKPPEAKFAKLGTFAGVFVPTTLNVLSILMFLRFGFILGQSGVAGIMGMLVAAYAIDLLTIMSVSAIATNGTVRGGGAYYLISRSLGPEFGGSIGIVFYLGQVFNTGMNAVGLIDCLIYNFGDRNGGWSQWLPDGGWWNYLWASIVLFICTAICLAGSGLFARASNGLLVILLISTFSIPISAVLVKPFVSKRLGIEYTGLSWETFKSNALPHFTKGADGSQLKGRENWRDLFGILFPATGGIFAGASMSGDLKHPSKAIPKGTLYGLGLTFVSYTLVILALAATVTRGSLYRNVNVMQDVNISGVIVLLGEFASTFFSALMGVIGSAKLLQALSRDNLIPGLSVFGQGTKGSDEPTYAIFITYIVAQLTMLADINQIASFVTMTYLMTFLVTNLACFLLTISSAPNFRPSFHFFNWQTAFAGTVVSGAIMFFVDRMYAAVSVAIMAFIFLLIHYTTPPKSWGDVSQSLIYHQVRKYLLRLRSDHIKFWRPSVLLLLNDPRRQYRLVQFCNSLKKGGLFILGHVIVTQDFAGAVQEAKRQQTNWQKYIDFSKIKAFINVCISPAVEWGARNIVLSSGLGGMRPNIVVMGFFNLNDLRRSQTLIDIPSPQPSRPPSVRNLTSIEAKSPRKRGAQREAERLSKPLPTDFNRPEGAISATSYMVVLEDLLLRLQINLAVAKGFQELELPPPKPSTRDEILSRLGWKTLEDDETEKKYIDLWPIQMSAEIATEGDDKKSVQTTNFDTYTLILQLGCILDTVPSWKRAYTVRVCVFVEYETDVEEERQRVSSLLSNLRIKADVLVFWLASGSLHTYEVVVNGKHDSEYLQALADVSDCLEDEDWWQDVQNFRHRSGTMSAVQEAAEVEGILDATANWPTSNFQGGGNAHQSPERIKFKGLRKILRKARRRASVTSRGSSAWGPMRANSSLLNADFAEHHRSYDSPSESSSSEEDDTTTGSDTDGDAVSEADADDYRPQSNREGSTRRTRSVGSSARPAWLARLNSEHAIASSSNTPRPTSRPGPRPTDSTSAPIIDWPSTAASQTEEPPTSASSSSQAISAPRSPTKTKSGGSQRPSIQRHNTLPKFSSKPVPATQVATDETQGRSIMFADSASPPARRPDNPLSSIYRHPPSSASQSRSRERNDDESVDAIPSYASSAPPPAAAAAIPLSFNDLPCRAQHLILNELMQSQSASTAVVFTTLPTPVEGTCESEIESVRYISDLEVLCHDLPPVLLVHSNSITVTMNL
jgi:potassium/chloride transporter 9